MGCSTIRPPGAPLLALAAAEAILRMDEPVRAALRALLLELRAGSRRDGDVAWEKRKGPMALYRHDIALHAGLLARALRRPGERSAFPAAPAGAGELGDDDHKPRSSRAAVRNPLLRLTSAAALQALPVPGRAALLAHLRGLARESAARADHCWSRRARDLALYWRASSVYAGHLARLLGRAPSPQLELPLVPGATVHTGHPACASKRGPTGSNTRCSTRVSGSAPRRRAAPSNPGSTWSGAA